VPEYDPSNAELKARFAKVLGSAVNPVLREGNSDRRAAHSVKEYARAFPHKMGPWSKDCKTHVSHMEGGDFYGSEQSAVMSEDCTVRIEFVAADGTVTQLKQLNLLAGEVVDASCMSCKALEAFFEKSFTDCHAEGLLISLHLKATMMKVSDPIMFGHAVKVFYKDLFAKHAELFKEVGVDANNGLGDVYAKLEGHAKWAEVEADIAAAYATRPRVAMVNSSRNITNFHVPSDVIIDASMPSMIRGADGLGGGMWTPDSAPGANDSHLEPTKALIPDRCYAGSFNAAIDFCREHGAMDPVTMGTVPNVGLMAAKAEEYGSHDKTFEAKGDGKMRVVKSDGSPVFEHAVETGDIWRMCQTKDLSIRDWVKLAVTRARLSSTPAVFWLDSARPHDANLIEKVNLYLKDHDTAGLDISIMNAVEATTHSLARAKDGKDTISVTGNVLRDYNTDLFPILELGTSAKMLSIVPLLEGGGLYETGAGGSAPKHVEQFLKENHLRWDSLGEFLALQVSLQEVGEKTGNRDVVAIASALDKAVGTFLKEDKSPGRKVNQPDNRTSHFYLGLYWAQEMAAQDANPELKAKFEPFATALKAAEEEICKDIIECQGVSVDIGGYYHPDMAKLDAAMRPSSALNKILHDFRVKANL